MTTFHPRAQRNAFRRRDVRQQRRLFARYETGRSLKKLSMHIYEVRPRRDQFELIFGATEKTNNENTNRRNRALGASWMRDQFADPDGRPGWWRGGL